MKERKRIIALIVIMAIVALSIGAIAILLLYRTAFEEERDRLVEAAQSQARLIEAVARFDVAHHKDYPQGPEQATLSQIADAHKSYRGFGKTGEFTLAKRDGDRIVFLLSHRHYDLHNPKPVSFSNQKIAEPMRRALTGMSGTVIGLDYRGERVLAAHEPVQVLNLGIVAKIDLTELRAPFIRAIIIVIVAAILVVTAGAALHLRISTPIIVELTERSAKLTAAIDQLKKEIAQRKAAAAALQESEERLRVSLGEKDVLLKEVHHRVKNNLQIIAGLLNMSSIQADHQEARDLLQDARGKVFAMALIHTQLYQTDRFDDVDMGRHTRHLVDQLALAHNNPVTSIQTTVDASKVRLTLSQAIPCGLVINELVSNAFKHAFRDRQAGRIHVSISTNGAGGVVLKVVDDGIGVPSDKPPEEASSLGLELVRRLVKQLHGTLKFNCDNGMEAIVTFQSVRSEAADV